MSIERTFEYTTDIVVHGKYGSSRLPDGQSRIGLALEHDYATYTKELTAVGDAPANAYSLPSVATDIVAYQFLKITALQPVNISITVGANTIVLPDVKEFTHVGGNIKAVTITNAGSTTARIKIIVS